LDVHKDTVVACLRRPAADGGRAKEVRTYGTMTRALLDLAEWLTAAGCTHVAMESTGVYWRPVYNVLGGSVELLLVNAQHLQRVPGRKTDVQDCEWLAELLEHGLLRRSFVPPAPIRALRELTRGRKQLIEQRARVANRVQKVLETANIKLGSVASDVLGASGRAMLAALVAGERDATVLAELAQTRLRRKRAELCEALTGQFTDHHAFLIASLLRQVEFLDAEIAGYDQRIIAQIRPFEAPLARLDHIPGIGRRGAECLLAELGPDMTRFPTAAHAASWTGICPGNNESAGKRRSGKTRKGNRWLRALLIECARAAILRRGSYFAAQYRHLVRRRGDKKAIVAVAHSLLIAAYHVLRDDTAYVDLGPHHFDRLHTQRLVSYHRPRLADLGYDISLHPKEEAASRSWRTPALRPHQPRRALPEPIRRSGEHQPHDTGREHDADGTCERRRRYHAERVGRSPEGRAEREQVIRAQRRPVPAEPREQCRHQHRTHLVVVARQADPRREREQQPGRHEPGAWTPAEVAE
jgi:transposase